MVEGVVPAMDLRAGAANAPSDEVFPVDGRSRAPRARRRGIWAPWLLAGAVIFAGRPAVAQVSAESVYQDARDIINDVIQREALQSIARQITCHSTNGLLLHYPRSLDDLYHERFEALAESFRSESARLLGAYMFSRIAFYVAPPLDRLVPIEWDGSCEAELTSGDLSPSQYLERTRPRPSPYLTAYDACSAGREPTPRRALACELGLAVEAAVADRLEEAHRRLVAVGVLPLALHVTRDEDFAPLWRLLTARTLELVDAARRTGGAPSRRVEAAMSQVVPEDTLQRPLLDLLAERRWTAEQRDVLLAAWLFRNEDRLSFEVAGRSVRFADVVDASLESSLGEVVERILAQVEVMAPAQVSVEPPTEEGRIVLRLKAAGAGVSGAGRTHLERLVQAARTADRLRELPVRFDDSATLVRFLNAGSSLRTLADAWREVVRQGHSARGVLGALDRSLGAGQELLGCGAEQPPDACIWLEPATRRSSRNLLGRVFRATESGLGVKAAIAGIDDVFDAAKRRPELLEHAAALSRLQAVANTLVAYVTTERGTARGADGATRAAFKAAAFDWMLNSRSGAGYFNGLPFEWITVSSGLSWSNGYVNRGTNGARMQVSAEALAGRWAPVMQRNLYFGVSISLLNLLGPMAELALRDPDARYARSNRVWLDFLQPRLDILLGAPSFSRRLVLYSGASLRPIAPFPANGLEEDFVYAGFPRGEAGVLDFGEPSDRLYRLLELGIGLRFFPL